MDNIYSGLAKLGDVSSSFWLIVGLSISSLIVIASIYIAFFRTATDTPNDDKSAQRKTALILFIFACLLAGGVSLNYYLNHRYKFYAAASGSSSIVNFLKNFL